MMTLLRKLYRTRLLSPVGLFYLLEAVLTTGVNLMALLRLAAKLHSGRTAVVDERERLTYEELWRQSETLARGLYEQYGVRSGGKVAIATRNHAATIKALFAVSRLGAHVFLVNPEMSADQILALSEQLKFDFYIYDSGQQNEQSLVSALEQLGLKNNSLPAYHPTEPSIDRLAFQQIEGSPNPKGTNLKAPARTLGLSSGRKLSARRTSNFLSLGAWITHKPSPKIPLKKTKPGRIIVMTGGTTGQPKPASRKPSLFTFLPPFVALLCRVHLDRYRSLYVATPIYHGFGLSALLIGVALGAELHVTQRFKAEQACELIAKRKIQVITLVPLMLQRMLRHDAASLHSLQRILTGGALLRPELATATLEQLGPTLFNLYGTSEAGFCIMGTPDLLRRKPQSIGQSVSGVHAKIENNGSKIGRLCIRSAWSTNRKAWIETGDLAYRDEQGDIFLCGRVDNMIVSGGENVYPIELETVLLQHPQIEAAAVLGIADEEFGQRLKAVVVGNGLNALALRDWLKSRVARYQMPAVIEFRQDLPYTALGKLDKKALAQTSA